MLLSQPNLENTPPSKAVRQVYFKYYLAGLVKFWYRNFNDERNPQDSWHYFWILKYYAQFQPPIFIGIWYLLQTVITISCVVRRMWDFLWLNKNYWICSSRNESTCYWPSSTKPDPTNRLKKHKWILQTEDFIQSLPIQNHELVENYIERFTDWLAEKEPYLYWQFFLDGVRILNFLRALWWQTPQRCPKLTPCGVCHWNHSIISN